MTRIPSLPDISLKQGDWLRLRSYLQKMKERLELLSQTFNNNSPDQVTDLRVQSVTGGIQLRWTATKNTTHYLVWRTLDSITFTEAVVVQTLSQLSRPGEYWITDPVGLEADYRVYWVQPMNGSLIGPVSEQKQIAEP